MSRATIQEWERFEVERSAVEASNTDTSNMLANARRKTVLEYGSGDGSNTLILAKRGAEVNAAILRRFPALSFYATTRVVEMVK